VSEGVLPGLGVEIDRIDKCTVNIKDDCLDQGRGPACWFSAIDPDVKWL
jgi:hypothetical protein